MNTANAGAGQILHGLHQDITETDRAWTEYYNTILKLSPLADKALFSQAMDAAKVFRDQKTAQEQWSTAGGIGRVGDKDTPFSGLGTV